MDLIGSGSGSCTHCELRPNFLFQLYSPKTVAPGYLFQVVTLNLKGSRTFKRSTMNATDAMFHLDALARSVPEPILPPSALNSRIPGILRATHSFLDTDHDLILQNIEVLQQQASVYDALLDRIDEVRSEMRRHRDVVHKSRAAYSSTLAPIRRLPTDILRTVFREIQLSTWSDKGSREDHQMLDFSQGPRKLSHVCGAWRDIVLSYPQLWSHLVLHFPEIYPDDYPPDTHDTELALKTMILHSAQCPLDIIFVLNDDYIEYRAAVQVFFVILKESCRWRSIDLQMSLNLLEHLTVVHGKIPCLESLYMQFETGNISSYHRDTALPKNVRSVFIDAPRLRKVALDGTHMLGELMFPLHITHLATSMDYASGLEAYQSLVECRLFGTPGPDYSPPHSIHLPNLRRLFVFSPRLLAYLHLPSLDHLMIYHASNGSDNNINDAVLVMNEFIHRSRCTLTSLAIHNPVAFQQVFIQDCLLLMDSLVSLQIEVVSNVNIEVIFDPLASSKFLPNLQHLSLRVLCASRGFRKHLTAMISSRSQYLRSIRISCNGAYDVERINEYLAPLRLPNLHMVVSWDYASSYFESFESG
ncbi:hypothetical protein EDD18DRAFT_349796 [Armillaria luteobubalina]|uniref:F-box domain-containing protein n=1 Tax=Armillaria luteobubalina TaxID=153913 RepID=A0AA39Q1V9_9AGAR|nr:hypothetical protein EDD18DRAFT_349796 [Armillaria luteobubalina]